MVKIARTEDFEDGNVLFSDELDGEIVNIINWLNARFDEVTGHDHDGVNTKPVSYDSLVNKPKDKNAYLLTKVGTLSVTTGFHPLSHVAFEDGTIVKVIAIVASAPTGADVIVDVNVNGSSIWDPGNELTIAAGTTQAVVTAIDNPSVSELDLITGDIDQIGSTEEGASISVYVIVESDLT